MHEELNCERDVVAIRTGAERVLNFWQPGLWNALDFGVLLTDLSHVSLMCNLEFGRLFEVDAFRVVKSGVNELRDRVVPYLEDPTGWLKNLDEIYAVREGVQRDELAISASMRRVERFTGPVRSKNGEVVARIWTFREIHRGDIRIVERGKVKLDLDSRELEVLGEVIALTQYEFGLLKVLMENTGTAMGREILFRRVWGYDIALNTNSLDVLISRLRKKIGCDAGVRIETVYGYGYRLGLSEQV